MKPDRATRKHFKLLYRNVETFFLQLTKTNALPTLRNDVLLPLNSGEVRLKVRKTIRAVTDEDSFDAASPDALEAYIDTQIAGLKESQHTSPYREACYILLAMMNAVVMLDNLRVQYPNSRRFARRIDKFKPICIRGLMHVYGINAGVAIENHFPTIATWWSDYS